MNAGAVQAAVIPSIHWAPASPLKLPLLNKMILYESQMNLKISFQS
jgi:hypothetical protein